jgi:putative PEP-CTERM system TPR-repeat lipoprotein
MTNKFRALKLCKMCVPIVMAAFLFTGCEQNKTAEEFIVSANDFIENENLNAAILELKNAIRIDPQNFDSRYTLGDIYLRQGNYELAKKELKKANELNSNSLQLPEKLAQVYYNLRDEAALNNLLVDGDNKLSDNSKMIISVYLGVNAFQNGDKDRAKSFINTARDISEQSIYSRLGNAWLISQNNLDASYEIIEKILNEEPSFREALMMKGHILSAQKKHSLASSTYRKYTLEYPFQDTAKVFLIQSLIDDNQFDEASIVLEPLLIKFPEHPLLNKNKALLAYNNKKYELALFHAKKSNNSNEGDVFTNVLIGLSAYKLDKVEESYSALRKVQSDLPESHPILTLFHALELKLGYFNKTANYYKNVETIFPDDMRLLTQTSIVLIKNGEAKSAKGLISKSDDVSILDPQTLAQLGQVKLELGDSSGLNNLIKATELAPDDELLKISLVTSLLKENKLNEAQETVNLWIEKIPNSEYALLMLSIIKSALEQHSEAVLILENLLLKNEKHVGALYRLSKYRLENNNYDEAISLAKRIIDIRINHIGAYQILELAAQKTKSYNEQITYLKEMREKQSNLLILNLTLAKMYIQSQNRFEALKMINLIEQGENLPANVLVYAGDMYLALKKPKQAIEVYRKALDMLPQSEKIRIRLLSGLELKEDYSGALLVTQQGLKWLPNSKKLKLLEVYYLTFSADSFLAQKKFSQLEIDKNGDGLMVAKVKGQFYLSINQFEKALPYLIKLNESTPTQKNIKMLAITYLKLGKNSNAAAELEKYLITNPKDNLVRSDLADIYALNEPKKSIEQFLFLIESNPKSFVFLNNLAVQYSKIGDYNKALDYAKSALRLAPKSSDVIDTIGDIYFQQKLYSEANEYFTEAYKLAHHDIGISLHFAESLIALSRDEEAVAILNKINSNNINVQNKVTELMALSKL